MLASLVDFMRYLRLTAEVSRVILALVFIATRQ